MKPRKRNVCILAAAMWLLALPSHATEWFVAPGGNGNGTSTAPFGRVQEGLNVARPGDTVTVRPGTYTESVHTVRNGSVGSPIRLRSDLERGSVVLTAGGKVLRIDHAYIQVEGLVP